MDIINVDGAEATLVPTDVKHYAITFDADGNEVRTEVAAPEAPVFVQGEEGAVASEYVEV
jgi:hypothetical protein